MVYPWGMDIFTIAGFAAVGLVWAVIIGAILWPLIGAFFLVVHLIRVELLGRNP